MNSKMIFAAVLLLATPAAAQDGIRAQLGNCLAIPGVLQRLSCYDAIAKGVAPAGAVPRAPATSVGAPPQAYAPPVAVARPVAPTGGFGGERLPQVVAAASAQRRSSSVISDIVKFDTTLRGKFVLTLANGQVWRQLDGDDAIARPRKTARTATIEHAIFDSYALTFNDSPMRYKVSRVQ